MHMKSIIRLLVMTAFWMTCSTALAAVDLSFLKKVQSYTDAKTALLDNGWKPAKNKRIDYSSLYAQEIYAQGMEEVVDCVSMELDGCVFRYTKNNQVLEIRTITRKLTLDSFKLKKP